MNIGLKPRNDPHTRTFLTTNKMNVKITVNNGDIHNVALGALKHPVIGETATLGYHDNGKWVNLEYLVKDIKDDNGVPHLFLGGRGFPLGTYAGCRSLI
jgi:hypothetical protein